MQLSWERGYYVKASAAKDLIKMRRVCGFHNNKKKFCFKTLLEMQSFGFLGQYITKEGLHGLKAPKSEKIKRNLIFKHQAFNRTRQ